MHAPVGHVVDVHEYPEPSNMPAFGLAAVPLPTKNRRIAPGYQPAIVAADGDPTAAAVGPTGSPVDTDAAGADVRAAPPNSRRLAAATVHANGPAAGPSPEPPEANHANRFEPTPRTPPTAAAARGAVITGADAAAGAHTAGADTAGADTATSAPVTESATVGAESLPPTGATTDPRDGTDASAEPGLTPTEPGATTAPERRSRALPADDPGPTPPLRPPEEAATGDSFRDDSPPTSLLTEPPRPARAGPRDGALVESDAADPEAAESAELDPDDPPDPVVSANATGTDATAEPTPNATAKAPTRPTYAA